MPKRARLLEVRTWSSCLPFSATFIRKTLEPQWSSIHPALSEVNSLTTTPGTLAGRPVRQKRPLRNVTVSRFAAPKDSGAEVSFAGSTSSKVSYGAE